MKKHSINELFYTWTKKIAGKTPTSPTAKNCRTVGRMMEMNVNETTQLLVRHATNVINDIINEPH